jgi:hypothetical protein
MPEDAFRYTLFRHAHLGAEPAESRPNYDLLGSNAPIFGCPQTIQHATAAPTSVDTASLAAVWNDAMSLRFSLARFNPHS